MAISKELAEALGTIDPKLRAELANELIGPANALESDARGAGFGTARGVYAGEKAATLFAVVELLRRVPTSTETDSERP